MSLTFEKRIFSCVFDRWIMNAGDSFEREVLRDTKNQLETAWLERIRQASKTMEKYQDNNLKRTGNAKAASKTKPRQTRKTSRD
jgi:hypothetical protein